MHPRWFCDILNGRRYSSPLLLPSLVDKRRSHSHPAPCCLSPCLFVSNQELVRKREEKSRKDKNRVASYNAAQRQNQNVRKPWVAHINAELNTASKAAAVAEASRTATATAAAAVATPTADATAAAAAGTAVVVGAPVAAVAPLLSPPAASGIAGVIAAAGVGGAGAQERAPAAVSSAAAAQPAPPATA